MCEYRDASQCFPKYKMRETESEREREIKPMVGKSRVVFNLSNSFLIIKRRNTNYSISWNG